MKTLFVAATVIILASGAITGKALAADPWRMLEAMGPKERANARIELEFGAGVPRHPMAGQIEELWNSGECDRALELLPELCRAVGNADLSLGVAWRTPVPTECSDWGNDVRIGNRDSVYCVQLDVHRATGNLIAVLAYTESGWNRWSVNLSADGGQTWSETFTWGSTTHLISGAFLGDYFYTGYTAGNSCRVRRFDHATGASVNFYNGASNIYLLVPSAGDSAREVAMCANQDYFNNRLYVFTSLKSDSLKYFWSDTGAVGWNQVPTGVADFKGGLDACSNEGYDSLYVWASYVSNADSVKIGSVSDFSSSWHIIHSHYSGASEWGTSIGAYQDTVLCAFHQHGPSADYVSYHISYDGGPSWWSGTIGSSDTTEDFPDVTARDGGGFSVAYRFFGATEHLRGTWRPYDGAWMPPSVVSDTWAYPIEPSIEYLGSGVFGTVFSSWSPVSGAAYFDRSDWTGVGGGPPSPLAGGGLRLGPNRPNPFDRGTTISYQLPAPGKVRLCVYNTAGQLVRRLADGYQVAGAHAVGWDGRDDSGRRVANGVYLCRLETASGSVARKMTLVK